MTLRSDGKIHVPLRSFGQNYQAGVYPFFITPLAMRSRNVIGSSFDAQICTYVDSGKWSVGLRRNIAA